MRRLNITSKLILIYLIVAIPLISIIAVTYLSWYRGRVDRALLERTEIAQLTGTSFSLFIRDLDKSMKQVGRAIVDNQYPPPKAEVALGGLHTDYPVKYAVFTDSSGIIVGSSNSKLLGQDLSKNPAFAAIIVNKRTTGIAPAESVNGAIGFYVTQAITSSGQLQGIVSSFVAISKLSSALPLRVVNGGANIVDSNGRLIYQGEIPNLPLTNPNWGKYGFVKTALSGKEAIATDFVFPSTGRLSIISEVPIKELGWAAGSSVDRSRAIDPVRQTALESAIAATLFSLLALAISIYIARGIVGALGSLVNSAKAVGEGDFSESALLKTGDEIEDVAISLDKARINLKQKVEDLRRSRDELEIRVEERTAELAALNGRMQSLLESTDQGIYGVDTEERCTIFNKSASKMSGYELDEMLGKVVHDLIHYNKADGSPYPLEECPVMYTIKTGHGERIDTEVFWRKDGSSFPVEYSAYPITENGIVKGAVVAFTDITERKRAEELSNALDDINTAISSTLNFDEIMERVVIESAKAIGAEIATVNLRENGYWILKYGYGVPPELIGTRSTDEKSRASVLVEETGKPVISNDAYNDERVNREQMVKRGTRSFIALPLTVKNKTIGVLFFSYKSAPIAFTDAQIDFATKLAISVSLALENARLYEAERNIANTLQEALLVLPQEIQGISFGHLYHSATEAAKVGGDFYDLFELENNKIGIIIGDVSGKGLEASTLTSITKNTLKAYAYENIPPASIMSKTNDAVTKAISPALFVTVFFAVLDTVTGTLAYCNAGHPASIIKAKEAKTSLLTATSPIIGAFKNLKFEDDTVTLKKEDILVLYTDGVIEARRNSDFFGEERLVSFIEGLDSVSNKELPKIIFKEVLNFTGGNLADDIAILTISLVNKKGG